MPGDSNSDHSPRHFFFLAGASLCAALVGAAVLGLIRRDNETPPRENNPPVTTVTTFDTTTSQPTTSTTSTTRPLTTTTAVFEATPPQNSLLSDLPPAETSGVGASPQVGLVKINGVSYPHGVSFTNSFCRDRQYVDYDLSRSYTKFAGKAGLPDTGRSDSPVILNVFLDGREVFEQQFGLGVAVQGVEVGTVGELIGPAADGVPQVNPGGVLAQTLAGGQQRG